MADFKLKVQNYIITAIKYIEYYFNITISITSQNYYYYYYPYYDK